MQQNTVRLNKFISESGLCSRREADRFIEQGNVFINGRKANIGDKVKVNSYCGTQYLRGSTATVIGMRQKKLLIKLDAPVGRFVRTMADGTRESSDIVVPPSILDKI